MIFVSTLVLASAAAKALPWQGEYELDNGIKITRTPSGVKVQSSGLNFNTGEYKFGKNSKLGNSCASESGCLSPSLEQKEFEKEVSKLGKIIKSNIKED